jgi:molecular chaperone DnaK
MPQIEVTFDIDANGILHVSAKDKATGKENKITIKASSGLSEAEIERMVKDAESHAEEDRKLLETVQARNGLDAMVHSVRKSLGEYGDKVSAEEKEKIEAALKDAEELLKNQQADKDALEAKSEALMKASQKLGEAMYAQSQAEAQAAGSAGGQGGDGSGSKQPDDEKVVDAEFTEVKDKK